MPRKKLRYTPDFPYHLCARSNNKEWFYLPKSQIWEIFRYYLNKLNLEKHFQIHAFVLMDNHYHLICSTHPEYNLGVVMQELQKSVSRTINSESRRINHVFGGPYKPSLIVDPEYYYYVYKYVYRNPIEAKLVQRAEDYKYSTLVKSKDLPLSTPATGIANLIPEVGLKEWINEDDKFDHVVAIRKGLRKTEFKPVKDRSY